jgi:hypothetical protein
MMTTIVDIGCCLLAAPAGQQREIYANPLRAWDGATSAESSFGFHEWMTVEVELASGETGVGNAALTPRFATQIVSRHLAPLVLRRRAVAIALWDAEAKHLGVPAYDLSSESFNRAGIGIAPRSPVREVPLDGREEACG